MIKELYIKRLIFVDRGKICPYLSVIAIAKAKAKAKANPTIRLDKGLAESQLVSTLVSTLVNDPLL